MKKVRSVRHGQSRSRLSIEPGSFAGRESESTTCGIRAVGYDSVGFFDRKIQKLEDLDKLKGKSKVLWIDVQGCEDHEVLAHLGHLFNIHRLALEDVINPQRPKLAQYGDRIFLVLQQLQLAPDLVSQQIAIAIGQGYIVTFHDGPWTLMDQLVDRIGNKRGYMRDRGSDYLIYSVIDAVVDSYFPLLENLGEQLEALENLIIEDPSRQAIADVHKVKRKLLILRRAMWPMRDVMNVLIRDAAALFDEESIVHLRDCYDHAVQIIDFIETYRELGADLMDVYLSSISNRMNEVMKVLTIITTIFIPPTLIAGIYGMNFHRDKSPFNMPELDAYYGYPLCLLVMAVMSVCVVGMLWWKGWLGALSSRHRQPSSDTQT
jgi:magnesium transporter